MSVMKKKKVLYDFCAWCEKNEIHLLRDDVRFIDKTLDSIPENAHRKTLFSYFTIWEKTINSGENMNAARRKANTWIRTENSKTIHPSWGI